MTPTAPSSRPRLVRAPHQATPPQLDERQQRVVEHAGGPLLVLAGPGTGKTTTLVEAIADRIERRGLRPDQVLALTFGRKAATELRDRVTARLGGTLAGGMVATFHSFAYGLVRRFAPAEIYAAPLRLLSAPEQDVVLRELLTDHPESVRWPADLRRAVGTRGFADEVNAVLSRAREKGLDGDALQQLGTAEGLPELVAAGAFLEQYLDTLDAVGATDYADLIRRAAIEAAEHRDLLRSEISCVFVDEYQDTDPGQVALLRQLAGDGRDLVVVGDPNQSIYGFRGAEVRGILDFPAAFPRSDGRPADVVALGTTRRFGTHLALAAGRVAARIPLTGAIPAEVRSDFAAPQCASDLPPGRVQVRTYDTDRAEAEHLADLLRRAHVEDGVAWHDMAVLVRSGRSTLPPLRRALGAAGVPVEVAADEVPLMRDPAVLPLLDALRAVVDLDVVDPDAPGYLHPARAEALLLGPLGGMDAAGLRRLSRALRRRAKAETQPGGPHEGEAPASSADLVRRVVVDPAFLDGLGGPNEGRSEPEGPEVATARALGDLLAGARAELDAGAPAEQVLWRLWQGTGWPDRLTSAVAAGGGAARRAHRDLDSICALFDAVARAEEQRLHLDVTNLLSMLAAQQIPADTLAERGSRGSSVRLLTAHRSKGLEWRLVVVAHVQAEAWPDLRRRASLLQPDRIGTEGLVPPVTPRALLAEERRLFYVACTRARERLVVTAVASSDDDGEQPSRFLTELLDAEPEHVVGRPRRPLSLDGIVAELRRTLADPASPEPLREVAARRLAALARERTGEHSGRQLVPQADPATWWGTRAESTALEPLRPRDTPVAISATVLEQLTTCPAAWFWQHEAGGDAAEHQSANLGQLVHALAEHVALDQVGDAGEGAAEEGGPVPLDAEALMGLVEEAWERMAFRTPWSKPREHRRMRAALQRFVDWHASDARVLLAVEARFDVTIPVSAPDAEDPGADTVTVRLEGYADRLELDADGAVVVVDLKTQRKRLTGPEVTRHSQLGLYQLAIDHGAVDDLVAAAVPDREGPARSGGAELVQLGLTDGIGDDGSATPALVQTQRPVSDESAERQALRTRIHQAASVLRAERFPATPGKHCERCDFQAICPTQGAGSVTAS